MPATPEVSSRTEQLRRLSARYWKPLFTAISALSALWGILKAKGIPSASGSRLSAYILMAAGAVIFVGIRFPRFAIAVTRVILGPPPPAISRSRIFRGPRPFAEEDAQVFPGREAELDDCVSLLIQQSFMVLEGESGCGKSSFLHAALVPKLASKFQVACSRIEEDPFAKLQLTLAPIGYEFKKDETDAWTIAALGSGANNGQKISSDRPPLLLCIDQAEELFVTVKDNTRRDVLNLLKMAVANRRLRLLVIIRSDFTDLLSRLCREVDPFQRTFNLGNYYTLRSFSPRQAAAVMRSLMAPLHDGDPLLVQSFEDFSDALIQQLLRSPQDKRLCRDDEKTVLPVELQTVGFVVESLSSVTFSVAELNRLGGTTGLLRAFVENATTYVFRKTGVPHNESILILRKLISPARTKWTIAAKSIAEDLKMPERQVSEVLIAFSDKYLVNRLVTPADLPDTLEERFELMHEHLVHILLDAPEPGLQRMRDAEERLSFWKGRTYLNAAKTSPPFAQPIPVTEVIRLWRFAGSKDDHKLLLRSARGFVARVLAVCVLFAVAASGWFIWSRTDQYQVRRVLEDAQGAYPHVDEQAIGDWMVTLIQTRVPGGNKALQGALEWELQKALPGKCLVSLARVSTAYGDAGDQGKADSLMAKARASCGPSTFLDTQTRSDFAHALHDANLDSEAKVVIERGMVEAKEGRDDGNLRQLAAIAAEVGNRDVAIDLAQSQLAELHKQSPGSLGYGTHFCELANLFLLLDEPEKAKEIATGELPLADVATIEMHLAEFFLRKNDSQAVDNSLRSAQSALEQSADAYRQFDSDLPLRIAELYEEAHRTAAARHIYAELETPPLNNPEILSNIALSAARGGDQEEAKKRLRQLTPEFVNKSPQSFDESVAEEIAETKALVGDYRGARQACAVTGAECSAKRKLEVYEAILLNYSGGRSLTLPRLLHKTPRVDCNNYSYERFD